MSGGGPLPAEAVQSSIERHCEGDPHESGWLPAACEESARAAWDEGVRTRQEVHQVHRRHGHCNARFNFINL